jgi:mono/diheme cytochrome c family protein
MKALKIALVGLVLTVAWGSVGSLVQQAPPGTASIRNPLEGDGRAQRAGAKLYYRECAGCHGLKREGRGRAPSLTRPGVTGAAPGALFWVLRNGALHRGMPSYAHLPEPQRWQIITFLTESTHGGHLFKLP